ncbi:phosphopantetheine-binding protein [Streptomyces sp. NPDC000987]|uniref:phosphopantetheine-binding protein n=1 Tax=unclassified Streptomyces TaxID=2593676 RepID=UPI002D79DD9D|nr:phosphopantetheine-binding protein [Streptomyces sp. H51]
MHDNDAVTAALGEVWTRVTGEPAPAGPAARAGSLWNLGLTSAGFIQLLAAVEDEFGFEWDLDDDISSFDVLAVHVAAKARRLPAVPGGR